MTTLTWLFWLMAVAISAYITFRITRWYYKRQLKKAFNDSSRPHRYP